MPDLCLSDGDEDDDLCEDRSGPISDYYPKGVRTQQVLIRLACHALVDRAVVDDGTGSGDG